MAKKKNSKPKRPALGASTEKWDKYEEDMALWTKREQEKTRRKGVKKAFEDKAKKKVDLFA